MPANAAKTATGKSLALALAFFVVLVSLALHVGLAKAGITVQVTNCTDPNQPPEKCHTTTPPKNGGSSHGTELHQYSLGKSQARQVRGPQGDQLTLDLAQEAKKQAAAAAPLVTDKLPKRIKRKPGSAGVGTVSTNGGSAFSGFGSDFNFVSGDEALSRFAIPPFLLPIYVSAGRAYGVPWNVLASINQIETDFGRISSQVSSAGAEGWMQFMPASWKTYGVDASGDGVADPYNPVDAIYAAARYLRAAGGDKDIRKAVFAYNHAGWYVDRVMSTAGIYGSLPSGLVAETGSLAFGHFPVHGRVLYGDDFRRAVTTGHKPTGLKMFPRTKKAAAVATQDVTVARILVDRRIAAALHRGSAPRPRPTGAPKLLAPLAPLGPLARLAQLAAGVDLHKLPAAKLVAARLTGAPASTGLLPAGYALSSLHGVGVEVTDPAGNHYVYEGLAKLADGVRPGGKLKGGATIGALSASPKVPLVFSVRAASGAPVDPRPLVDGYRLQEVANYYHAVAPLGGNPFLPDQSLNPGGAFSGSDRQLASKVLSDSGIQIYACGQQDIQHGDVDRRILGALLYLRRAGMTLTVTSLRCGHGFYTASGNVSAHSYGAAVDIAAFDGQPVVGHQGPGSLTEQAIKLLMQLDGQARPAQLISLMNLGGPSFALADHYDHLHVGYSFQPALGLGRSGDSLGNILFGGSGVAKPHGGKAATKAAKAQARSQERRLSQKLGGIANPRVHKGTGPGSIPIEGEKPSDRAAAARKLHKDLPFETAPTSSGARTVAIDTPDAGGGDEAYAIGIVDGSARGWARKQTVVLAFRDGAWRIVGPPRDARGHIVNPHLRALATVAGGRGYAVGRRGTIVALRGGGSPRLLPPSGHAALRDVVVDGPDSGYAVGSGGALMRIAGKHATREQGAPKSVDFESVTLGGGGDVTAVGAKAANQPAAYQRSGSWQPLNLGFKFEPGSGGTLTAVAARGDQLWVAGSYGPGTGAASQLPFAARRSAGAWQTFCSIDPALANIRELGNKSSGPCDHGLVTDPGEHGPVADVALTKQGTLLASSSALHLLAPGQTSFRPVPVALSTTSRIEAVPRGRGWLLGSDGRMSRLTPRGQGASLLASPSLGLPLGGKPGAVAVTPSGDRALAFSGARTAVYAGGHWLPGATTQLPVRDAAISGSAAMAIDEMGTLISYGTDGWSVPGADGIQKTARSVFARALGSQPLGAAASAKSSSGLQALTMNSPAEAFAVGAGGVIEHYKLGDWSHEGSPVSTTLRDVAVGPWGAVAVGDHGTLLERSDGSWKLSVDAAKLVRGEGFTAVETLDDGTLLASAGGTMIERGKSDKAWHLAGLTPLGLTVAKLSGYRDHDGHLQAIALAGEGQHLSLLAGDSAGWRPVELPDGLEVTSFARQPGTAVVWIAGWRMGSPVVVHLDLARGKGGNG